MAETAGAKLIIEKYYDGFRFYFDGSEDKRSWLVKHNDKLPWLAILVEEEKRQSINIIDISYRDFDIVDIEGLFILLITRPQTVLRRLLGEKVQVNEVTIRYHCFERLEDFGKETMR
ncbi:hypothetical protein DDW11_01360 [Sulfolobus sp. SCGC AB-777_G06]|nr:hypothetical protein DDW11_01360 [Sulfolobus sp. SCGC AB-777_G06]